MKNIQVIFTLILLSSCGSVLLTGRKQLLVIPNSQMLALSSDSYSQVLAETPVSSNAEYIKSVKRVGAKGELPPEILLTHPLPDTRIEDLKKFMPKALEYYNSKK